jgi:serine/threonine protein phosphatase 1
MRTLIIGDIHGCIKTFKALLDKIGLKPNDNLYLLGDYVDRGPDSKKVIDTILELIDSGYQVHCLRGNHEQMLLDIFDSSKKDDIDAFEKWLYAGGKETMHSFGKEGLTQIPPLYFDFLNRLPYYIEVEGLILVHAALDFKLENPFLNQYDMIWKRHWYNTINYAWLNKRTIVHGHTPVTIHQVEWQLKHQEKLRCINVDAGAVFSVKNENEFALCCLDWTNQKLYFQETIDVVNAEYLEVLSF